MENTKPEGPNFNVENGLSMLIEKDGKTILFDTGSPKNYAIQNAEELGIDLSKVDAVVISHGHDDHTGGLLRFFEINDNAPVYIKKEALNPIYVKRPDGEKYIGSDGEIVEEHSDRLHFIDKTIEIVQGVFLVSQIERKFPIPSTNSVLFVKEGDKLVNDTFEHELFMVVENDDNLTVFSGCGHNGIKNIVSTAKETFPNKKIGTVIGGFHLQAGGSTFVVAKKEEIEEIANWLKLEVTGQIYTGHCTGKRGMEIMKPILNEKLKRIHTGMKINL